MIFTKPTAHGTRRWFSAMTALVLVLAMVGPLMPVPVLAEDVASPEAVASAVEAPPVAPAPEAPAPAVEPPTGSASRNQQPDTSLAAASTEVAPVTVSADKNAPAPEVVSAPVAPVPAVQSAAVVAAAAPVVASGGSFGISLEGRDSESPKWNTGNLGKKYKEGDLIWFRAILDNSGVDSDYVVPAFALRVPFYRSQSNAIGVDWTESHGTKLVTATADSDPLPSGLTPLAPNTLDGPYPPGSDPVTAEFLASYYNAGRITVPANKIVVLYFQAHLARTDTWLARTPSRYGSSEYPGSSSHFALAMTGFGDKDVPWPQVQPLGSPKIVVHKFNDLDGDKIVDVGELPLSGWTFTLVGSHGVNASKTTTASGVVEFTTADGVEPGNGHSYTLNESGGDGPVWYHTTALPITIPFGLDDGSDTEWVGNRQKVTKTFLLHFAGDAHGATFRADYYEGAVKTGSATLASKGGGSYEGTAGVMAVTTFSSVKWYAVYGGTDLLLGTTGPETIAADKLNEFTYTNTVSGAKRNDTDNDGNVLDTDAGLADWTINLYRGTAPSGTLWDTATTGADGTYSFSDLLPGTYYVQEVLKAGWQQTFAPASFTIPLTPGAAAPSLVFLNHLVPTGKITVHKFNDLNGDGVRQTGEDPLSGWEFTLTGPFGYSASKTTTGAGVAEFTGLEPGTYSLDETGGHGPAWYATTALPIAVTLASGGTDTEWVGNREKVTKTFRLHFAGDAHGATFRADYSGEATGSVTLTSIGGGSYEGAVDLMAVTHLTKVDWVAVYDGRDYILGTTGPETISANKLNEFTYDNTLSGHKRNDTDKDGDVTDTDAGLPGWTIQLYRIPAASLFTSVGGLGVLPPVLWDTTTTVGASGVYNFPNLLPGTYFVKEVLKGGWEQTHEPGGTYPASDGSAYSNLDFLNHRLPGALVAVNKFNDFNGNGTLDVGEPPLAGWKFTLTGPLGYSKDLTTGADGVVEFTDLEPGAYSLTEAGGHGPVWFHTTVLPIVINLEIDQQVTRNVGNREQVTKTFRLHFDGDAHGAGFRADYYVADALAGSVELKPMGGGSYEGTAPIMAVTTLSKVEWVAVYSGHPLLLGTTGPETIRADKLNEFTYDNSASGHKFNDLDNDGKLDAGEPAMGDWTIQLYRIPEPVSFDQVVAAALPPVLWDTKVTVAPDGTYEFTGLLPGTYFVKEVLKSGWAMTHEPGTTFDAANGSAAVNLDFLNHLIPTGKVTVHKFNDLDGDGIADAGEGALSGWTFTLTGPLGYSASKTTAADGIAEFTDLEPGLYSLTEAGGAGPKWFVTSTLPVSIELGIGGTSTQWVGNREKVVKTFHLDYAGPPAGATFWVRYTVAPNTVKTLALVAAGAGSYEAAESMFAVTHILGVEWMATLGGVDYVLGSAGAEDISADTLNSFVYNNAVSGTKFNDVNANGVRDTGDAGLAGWTINLYRQTAGAPAASALVTPAVPAGYALVDSTTTAADGSYAFANLLPGTYFLAETAKTGWNRTVGAGAAFAVADGSAVTGRDFGNNELFIPFTEPDLAITKAVSPTTAKPGDTLTYTLTYRNTGDGAATDFVITDTFESTKVDVVDAAGGAVSGNTITWKLAGPLAPGASGTIVYKMKIKATLPAGTTKVENRVTIGSPGLTDKTPVDDSDSAVVTVNEPFLPFTGG
ncbi:MAG TPA: SdrD B-like domain-containing protein, partial [Coriobacteriia bacterium]